MKRILVTGGAGFIGSHVVDRLLDEKWAVTVLDNLDAFYDPAIKRKNITRHLLHSMYEFVEGDIRDRDLLSTRLRQPYDAIIHIAAKAGVRPSIEDPSSYQDVNVRGTLNLLEFARLRGVSKFVFASSSSVYGTNPNVPWKEDDCVLFPISPYAATKLSAEFLGHVYSHLYGICFVALRFFTVYGPRQRPDLAIHKFARQILSERPITLFGDGTSKRDYTYVADIVAGVCRAIQYSATPYEVINLGNNRTVTLLELIRHLEHALRAKARITWMPEQAGDVPQTYADISKARRLLDYDPRTPFAEGLAAFAEWMLHDDAAGFEISEQMYSKPA